MENNSTQIQNRSNCLSLREKAEQAGLKTLPGTTDGDHLQWFAMRDLRRSNARVLAWQQLSEAGLEVFTPLHWIITRQGNRRQRIERPVIADLLFVHSTRRQLDPYVEASTTLQYRFAKGAQAKPITVRATDMNRFVQAVTLGADTRYYLPDEVTPEMYGQRVRLVGGPLDSYEGNLLYVRGSHKKRLLVELSGFITAAVEVQPEYIQLIP